VLDGIMVVGGTASRVLDGIVLDGIVLDGIMLDGIMVAGTASSIFLGGACGVPFGLGGSFSCSRLGVIWLGDWCGPAGPEGDCPAHRAGGLTTGLLVEFFTS